MAEGRLAQLRAAGPAHAARLVWRKAVHRRVTMGRWGGRAGDHVDPGAPEGYRTEILGPDTYDAPARTNPHLTEDDLAHFRRQESRLIVVHHGDEVAATSWMTQGQVWCNDLQRTLHLPEGEHFSCRSFVAPDHRGRALLSHMIATYAATVPPDDEIWGVVFEWNTASALSLERIGWRHTGTETSTYLFGVQRASSTRTPPRPLLRLPS